MTDPMGISEHCTPEMRREGARALQLWADESLREEIDAERMAELVWKAMTDHQRGAVSDEDEDDFDKLLQSIDNLRGYRCAEQTTFLMHVEAVYVQACALAEQLRGAVDDAR